MMTRTPQRPGILFTIAFFVLVSMTCASLALADDALQTVQDHTIEKLESIETKVDTVLDTVEGKTHNNELKESIQENQNEIDELMETQAEAIQDAESIEEVKEIVVETAQRMILKTYDAITPEESLDEIVTVDGTPQDQEEAIEVALDSMVDDDSQTYTIQLTTAGSFDDAMQRLHLFDPQIQGTLLFETEGETTIELTVDESSLLSQELLAGLEDGQVPDALIGFRVNKPAVFRIEAIDLGGEQLDQLRGIREYATYQYLDTLPLSQTPVKVGVLDTGIDATHPDLTDRMSTTIPGYDFFNDDTAPADDHYHGTHVAGTIGASINGQGIIGVNPHVELIALKICNAQGRCPSYAVTNALKYATDQGVDILNMSLGGLGDAATSPICDGIAYANEQGTIAIVAAGNAGTHATTYVPAGCDHTIVVGAIDTNDHGASFSNYGSIVDIAAPGVGIYSSQPGGGYRLSNGTSMATPHVVGLASIIRSVQGPQPLEAVKALLLTDALEATYDPGKPVGQIINIPAVMALLGASGGETLCTNGQLWDGQACVDEESTDDTLPLLTNRATGVTIKVGSSNTIKVRDGAGIYGITRTDPTMLGYGIKNTAGEGIFIASAQTTFEQAGDLLPSEPPVVVDDEMTPGADELIELGGLEDGLGTEEEMLTQGVEIAGAKSNPYLFRVVGIQPGETTITIHDTNGREVVVPVTIAPRVLKLNNAKQRKRIKGNGDRWKITQVLDYDESLLAVKYMGDWKRRLTGKTDAVTTITLEVFNEVEQRLDTMDYTLLIGDAHLPVEETTERSDCDYQDDQCADLGTQTRTHTTTTCIGGLCEEEVVTETQSCQRVAAPSCFITVQENIVLDVGSSMTLDILGGAGGYHITRDHEGVGFGVTQQGVQIASAGASISFEQGGEVYDDEDDGHVAAQEAETVQADQQDTGDQQGIFQDTSALFTHQQGVTIASTADHPASITLLGLQPGETTLTITDQDGQTKEVTVTVRETVYRMRPDARAITPLDSNRWFVAKREPHSIPDDLLDRFSYYREGQFKVNTSKNVEGEEPMSRTIYNTYEQKFQQMHWTLRVAPTQERLPFAVNLENILYLEAGEMKRIEITGGLPWYDVSHSSDAIRVYEPEYASPYKSKFTVRDSSELISVSSESIEDEMTYDGLDDTQEVGEAEQSDDQGVAVQAVYVDNTNIVELHALTPGESLIRIQDQAGGFREMRVVVTEKVLETRVGQKMGWYYRPIRGQDFYVHAITSSNPDIVVAYRDGKSYETQVLQPGRAVVTVTISDNKYGFNAQELQVTILTKSDTPLATSHEHISLEVGQSQEIELTGGLPKYLISKSNSIIGLGSQNQTTAIGVAGEQAQPQPVDLNYIVTPGDDVYTPYEGDDEMPVMLEIEGEEIIFDDIELTEEDFEDDVTIAGSSPVFEVKPNHLSVIGLQPGTSEVTVTDEAGDQVIVTVEVLPKAFAYQTMYNFATESRMGRYDYRPDRLSRGEYDRVNGLYRVEEITVDDGLVYIPYFRKWKGWYGRGGVGGTTTMRWRVYLPLEHKSEEMVFEVSVEGPTVEEVTAHWKKVVAYRKRMNGTVSSINPGGGGFSSGGGSSNGSSSSTTSERDGDLYLPERSIDQSVGEFTVIDVYAPAGATIETSYDEDDGFIEPAAPNTRYEEKLFTQSDAPTQFLGLDRYEVFEDDGVGVQGSSLGDVFEGLSKRQFVVGCKSGEYRYTLEIPGTNDEVTLICNGFTKTYHFEEGTSQSVSTKGLSMRAAYTLEENRDILHAWYNSSAEQFGIEARSVGSTEMYVEFGGPEHGKSVITKFEVPVEVYEEGGTPKQVIRLEIPVQLGKVYEMTLPGDNYEITYHKSFVLGDKERRNVELIDRRDIAIADASDFLMFAWDYIKFTFQEIPDGVYQTVFTPTIPGSFEFKFEGVDRDIILKLSVGVHSVSKDIYREKLGGDEIFEFEEDDLTIEEYTAKLFELAFYETMSLPYDIRPVFLYEKFADTGPWNFKYSLNNLGYLSHDGERFDYNGTNINGADLGNLMFGYISYHGGFYDDAVRRAYEIEVAKFTKYYGYELGLVRTEIDEANDLPMYAAGKTIGRPGIYIGDEISNALDEGIAGKRYTEEEATKELEKICDQTYGNYVAGASLASYACLREFYDDYYIIVDKPLSIIKMVVVPRDVNGINLIPLPVLEYD